MRLIWNSIEKIVTLWGLVVILAIIADVLGVLPYYDILYIRSTDITPRVFLYPGQNVRLSAEFARSVNSQEIEKVVWNLKDSSGKDYGDLPNLRDIDVTLIPDFSGTVNVTVRATLLGENEARHGTGSIQIVQTKPHRLAFLRDGTFVLPPGLEKVEFRGMQLYGGSSIWYPASAATEESGKLRLMTEDRPFPTWDGKAFIRYKTSADSRGLYQYHTVTALNPGQHVAPRAQ